MLWNKWRGFAENVVEQVGGFAENVVEKVVLVCGK